LKIDVFWSEQNRFQKKFLANSIFSGLYKLWIYWQIGA